MFLTCEKMDQMHVYFKYPFCSTLEELSPPGAVPSWVGGGAGEHCGKGKRIGSWQNHMKTVKASACPWNMQRLLTCQWPNKAHGQDQCQQGRDMHLFCTRHAIWQWVEFINPFIGKGSEYWDSNIIYPKFITLSLLLEYATQYTI